jgi:pimeloyl-ACP methyl ester carboxylesterase
VRDAEAFRRHLGAESWSVLGQSFGGFCALTYLSFAPEGLREVLITGGLAPLQTGAEDVYRSTYRTVLAKNAAYYARYPQDGARTTAIARYLTDHEVELPGGGLLTPQRFQTLGQLLGAATGAEALHYLVESAFVPGRAGPVLADAFLREVQERLSFAGHPLYALLHEASYCQGTAARWAAHRVRDEFAEFGAEPDGRPVTFTGEMIFPWMLDADPALQPLREPAHLLAEHADWPPLYDLARLRENRVPVAAAVYFDDMYVAAEYSLQTAAAVGNLRPWVTNECEHDGLRMEPRLLDRLIAMVRGEA